MIGCLIQGALILIENYIIFLSVYPLGTRAALEASQSLRQSLWLSMGVLSQLLALLSECSGLGLGQGVVYIYIWTKDMPGDDETHFGMKLTPGVNQSNEWRDRCRLSMSS